MKKLLTLICTFSLAATAYSQNVFQKAYSLPFSSSLVPTSIATSSDGGYLIGTGSGYWTYGPNALLKLDANGAVQWSFRLNDARVSDVIDFRESVGGGYYAFGSAGDSVGGMFYYLMRFDASMNVLWTKEYPRGSAWSYGYDKIQQASDGTFMVSESNYSSMGVIKLDANGNMNWHYAFSDDTSMGKCPSFDCAINPDGSALFTGKRGNDICFVKIDASGQQQWIRTYNANMHYYHTRAVAASGDGGYIMAGFDDSYPFMMKTDANGTILWYKVYSTPVAMSVIEDISVNAQGEISFVGGDSYSNVFVGKADASGNIISTQCLVSTATQSWDLSFNAPVFCIAADGNIAMAASFSSVNNGTNGLCVLKTDANFNLGCLSNSFAMIPYSGAQTPASISAANVSRVNMPLGSWSATYTIASTNTIEGDYCLLFNTPELNNTVSVNAYPSPINAGNMLTIESAGIEGQTTISMYDVNGRLVKEEAQVLAASGSKIYMNTEAMAPGVYMIRMSDADGNAVATQRVVVR
jgi:hypothetical protein